MVPSCQEQSNSRPSALPPLIRGSLALPVRPLWDMPTARTLLLSS